MRHGVDMKMKEPTINVNHILTLVDEFYSLADKRDEAMLDNLIRRMDETGQNVGVLVAGGYHSEGVTQLIKDRNMSYATITPQIDSMREDVAYMDRMMGKIVPVDSLLTSHFQFSRINAAVKGLDTVFGTHAFNEILRIAGIEMKGQTFLNKDKKLLTQADFEKLIAVVLSQGEKFNDFANALELIAKEIYEGELMERLTQHEGRNFREEIGKIIGTEENLGEYRERMIQIFSELVRGQILGPEVRPESEVVVEEDADEIFFRGYRDFVAEELGIPKEEREWRYALEEMNKWALGQSTVLAQRQAPQSERNALGSFIRMLAVKINILDMQVKRGEPFDGQPSDAILQRIGETQESYDEGVRTAAEIRARMTPEELVDELRDKRSSKTEVRPESEVVDDAQRFYPTPEGFLLEADGQLRPASIHSPLRTFFNEDANDGKLLANLELVTRPLENLAKIKKSFREMIYSAVELTPDQVVQINRQAQKDEAVEIKLVKEQKVANLRAFAEQISLESLEADEATMLLNEFMGLGSWEGVLYVYEQSENEIFKQSSVIREYYAVALNKTGQEDRSIDVSLDLIEEGLGNFEVYSALGKAYKQKGNLQKAFEFYREGFLLDFDYYPGINMIYLLNQMGQKEQAANLSEMVYYATEKAGGIRSDDYWVVVTMLEVMMITREYTSAEGLNMVNNVLQKVLSVAKNEWEIETTLDNLRVLLADRKADQEDTATLQEVVDALQQKMDSIHALIQDITVRPPSFVDKRNDITKAVQNSTFHYRGLSSNFVAGNYAFNGQLHDHTVNRGDIAFMNRILDRLDINETTDIETFNQKINELLRIQFGTDGLEDLHSAEHGKLDQFMLGLKDISGARIAEDSRTNIVTDFIIGEGDCRHHAFFKQLAFDIWKNNQLSTLMQQAYNALMADEMESYQRFMEEVQSLERTQMYVADTVVWPQIEVEEMYRAKVDTEGNYIKSEEFRPYEEHALNVLVRYDKEGNVESMRLADSFYQNHYDFGDHDAVPSITEDRQLELNGGTILVNDHAGNTVEAHVKLVPAPFAGKRDKPNTDEYGQLRIRGITVNTPEDLTQLLRNRETHPVREKIDSFVDTIIDFVKSNQDKSVEDNEDEAIRRISVLARRISHQTEISADDFEEINDVLINALIEAFRPETIQASFTEDTWIAYQHHKGVDAWEEEPFTWNEENVNKRTLALLIAVDQIHQKLLSLTRDRLQQEGKEALLLTLASDNHNSYYRNEVRNMLEGKGVLIVELDFLTGEDIKEFLDTAEGTKGFKFEKRRENQKYKDKLTLNDVQEGKRIAFLQYILTHQIQAMEEQKDVHSIYLQTVGDLYEGMIKKYKRILDRLHELGDMADADESERIATDEFGSLKMNTIAQPWDVLISESDRYAENSTGRKDFLVGLQEGPIISNLLIMSIDNVMESLAEKMGEQGVTADAVDAITLDNLALRTVNAMWRLTNPWNSYKGQISEAFSVEEGEGLLGVVEVKRDDVVFKPNVKALYQKAAEGVVGYSTTDRYAPQIGQWVDLDREIRKNLVQLGVIPVATNVQAVRALLDINRLRGKIEHQFTVVLKGADRADEGTQYQKVAIRDEVDKSFNDAKNHIDVGHYPQAHSAVRRAMFFLQRREIKDIESAVMTFKGTDVAKEVLEILHQKGRLTVQETLLLDLLRQGLTGIALERALQVNFWTTPVKYDEGKELLPVAAREKMTRIIENMNSGRDSRFVMYEDNRVSDVRLGVEVTEEERENVRMEVHSHLNFSCLTSPSDIYQMIMDEKDEVIVFGDQTFGYFAAKYNRQQLMEKTGLTKENVSLFGMRNTKLIRERMHQFTSHQLVFAGILEVYGVLNNDQTPAGYNAPSKLNGPISLVLMQDPHHLLTLHREHRALSVYISDLDELTHMLHDKENELKQEIKIDKSRKLWLENYILRLRREIGDIKEKIATNYRTSGLAIYDAHRNKYDTAIFISGTEVLPESEVVEDVVLTQEEIETLLTEVGILEEESGNVAVLLNQLGIVTIQNRNDWKTLFAKAVRVDAPDKATTVVMRALEKLLEASQTWKPEVQRAMVNPQNFLKNITGFATGYGNYSTVWRSTAQELIDEGNEVDAYNDAFLIRYLRGQKMIEPAPKDVYDKQDITAFMYNEGIKARQMGNVPSLLGELGVVTRRNLAAWRRLFANAVRVDAPNNATMIVMKGLEQLLEASKAWAPTVQQDIVAPAYFLKQITGLRGYGNYSTVWRSTVTMLIEQGNEANQVVEVRPESEVPEGESIKASIQREIGEAYQALDAERMEAGIERFKNEVEGDIAQDIEDYEQRLKKLRADIKELAESGLTPGEYTSTPSDSSLVSTRRDRTLDVPREVVIDGITFNGVSGETATQLKEVAQTLLRVMYGYGIRLIGTDIRTVNLVEKKTSASISIAEKALYLPRSLVSRENVGRLDWTNYTSMILTGRANRLEDVISHELFHQSPYTTDVIMEVFSTLKQHFERIASENAIAENMRPAFLNACYLVFEEALLKTKDKWRNDGRSDTEAAAILADNERFRDVQKRFFTDSITSALVWGRLKFGQELQRGTSTIDTVLSDLEGVIEGELGEIDGFRKARQVFGRLTDTEKNSVVELYNEVLEETTTHEGLRSFMDAFEKYKIARYDVDKKEWTVKPVLVVQDGNEGVQPWEQEMIKKFCDEQAIDVYFASAIDEIPADAEIFFIGTKQSIAPEAVLSKPRLFLADNADTSKTVQAQRMLAVIHFGVVLLALLAQEQKDVQLEVVDIFPHWTKIAENESLLRALTYAVRTQVFKIAA
ncbi:MAG: DUF4071 domain-containing protein [Candidatus Omnitrophica bacterium]|nr:DUF4071 domain-containing protein [Candidatus Omnitrophota bacterium]